MKHLSASFTKLVAVVACAFTLGSCNRAEYAMLPKSSSYHGESRVATAAPAAAAERQAEAVPSAAPVEVTAAPQPAATVATVAAKPAPATEETKKTVAAATVSPTATVVASGPVAPRKLNLVQRLAVSKVTKQLSKAAGVTQFKQRLATAEAQKISGNLRTGIVLILLGLLISIFARVSYLFGVIGGVIALIGLIFVILYLLDNV